jgi:hypothetical protein
MKTSTRRSTAIARTELFLDTSGLYALIDRQDAHHTTTRRLVEERLRTGYRLVTADAVVSETLTLARMRAGPAAALRVLDLLALSVGIRLERLSEARFDAAKAFFRRHTADHGYSFVDCTSLVIMRDLGLSVALTTDRHFIEAGFSAPLIPPRRRS